MGYFSNVILMIVQTIVGLISLILLLRVILPMTRVRFSNPVCQMVYKATNPVVGPLMRIVPNYRRFCVAAALVLWLFCSLAFVALMLISTGRFDPAYALLAGFGTAIYATIGLYFWGILFYALLSFFAPNPNSPAVEVLRGVMGPPLWLFRNFPPRLEGLSLAPMWAGLSLAILNYTLRYLGLPGIPFL